MDWKKWLNEHQLFGQMFSACVATVTEHFNVITQKIGGADLEIFTLKHVINHMRQYKYILTKALILPKTAAGNKKKKRAVQR